MPPRLLAISDLHVAHKGNRAIVEGIHAGDPGDWLIVAGDAADAIDDAVRVLELLRGRFERVLWVPGNHELLAHGAAPPELRGDRRYLHLVERCRSIGVDTPEDPWPVWTGPGGPAVVAPMFLLYDYGFGRLPDETQAQALARATAAEVVAIDEYLLDPAPFRSREDWCLARVIETEARLASLDPALPTVLVNHWPLIEHPTRVLHHPEFALWCGTPRTADWHTRFRAAAVVYGHLHIPRRSWTDGVRFEEVSLGYPREWGRRGAASRPRQILPWAGVDGAEAGPREFASGAS